MPDSQFLCNFTNMINNNLENEESENECTNATSTITGSTTIVNLNSTNDSSYRGKTNSNGNSNSNYFNRFDNRIAANLAAVINSARFRSSSCSSKSMTTRIPTKTHLQLTNANISSNSGTNLTDDNLTHHHYHPHQKHRYLQQPQYCKSNNTNKLHRQTPPSFLYLQNNGGGGGDCSKPSSPVVNNRKLMGHLSAPLHLFTQATSNYNDNEKIFQPPNSDEENSPTELNNCKRLAEKPPLVKRLTMGVLRSNEESRPLVNHVNTSGPANTNTNTNTPKNILSFATHSSYKNMAKSSHNSIYSNRYINEEIFEPERFIASRFGDSCRQSLTTIPMLNTLNLNDNSEFNLKKHYLRETSSANSSPKISSNRLRLNVIKSRDINVTANNSFMYSTTEAEAETSAEDVEEVDLKDASWFQEGISREIAVEVLSNKSPGAFLVRKSSSNPSCFALTLRVPSPPGPKIANYIILRTTRGYQIKGFRKEFTTLKSLITHHSVMPELLPVPLAMPRPSNITSSRRNLDDFDTYESLQILLKYLRSKNIENNE